MPDNPHVHPFAPRWQAVQAISETKLPLPRTPIGEGNGLKSTKHPDGRLAQPVRAPALQAGGPRFEPATAHHRRGHGRLHRQASQDARSVRGTGEGSGRRRISGRGGVGGAIVNVRPSGLRLDGYAGIIAAASRRTESGGNSPRILRSNVASCPWRRIARSSSTASASW